MSKTLQVMARPPGKSREVPCIVRQDAVLKALMDQITSEVEGMTRKKIDLERKLVVLNVLKEMGL